MQRSRWWLAAAGLAVAAAGLPALAKTPAPKAAAEAAPKVDIPFEKYRLDNGLEVILHHDDTTPLVAVSVWYHVGAVDEPAGRTGFAHLFEHMMFQGSAHVGDDQHFKILENAGASMINGTTDFDRTNYIETVPANQLETALWLESDRMGYLTTTLTQDKLDTQRKVVMNERRQSTETQPYGLAEEKMWHALFPASHPYHGMVIGSMKDLGAASVDDVKAFFHKWYAPANATLAIAGDFDPATIKDVVAKYFATLPSGPKPEKPEVAKVSLDEETVIHHDETVAKLAKVEVSWLTPALYQPGDADLDILGSILTLGESGLLQRRLVRDLGLAQSVAAYQQSEGEQSVFTIQAVARPGVKPERLLTEIDQVLDGLRKTPPSADEVRRQVRRYEVGYVSVLQTLGGFSGRLEQLQRYNHYKGDPGWITQDLKRYYAVTPETVSAAAREWLPKDRRVVLFAVPAPKAPSEATASAAPAAEKKEVK